MTSKEIRQQFLDFFAERGHAIVPSAPVAPLDDPTLLFTNAGMNQFKDVFLGTGSRSYTRAADTQKCIRAGGKHNDLDDVGRDTYHHTFFEMLGNWSFGDYFKKEAIQWAWELLTKVFGIDKTRLHATYFEGKPDEGLEPDHETRDLWTSVTDIDPANVHPGNMKDNFWEMGDTGPCGPCSEIHIDLTPDKSGASLVNAGDHRVIEIWNLVFIQLNRAADRKLTPLPAKHVDTGMGFERLCAVLAGKSSNYDTDVWAPIFDAIQKRTGAAPYTGLLTSEEPNHDRKEADAPQPSRAREEAEDKTTNDRPALLRDVSYRIIADHVRCLTFALTDGAIPSNEGRGYVLRRILRRAVRYGRQYFDMHEPFLCDLVAPLVEHMADAFPELRTANAGKNVQHVTDLIRDEEQSFGRTLDCGLALFDAAAADALGKAVARERGLKYISSTTVFWEEEGRESDVPPAQNAWQLRFHDRVGNVSHVHIPRITSVTAAKHTSDPLLISGEAAFKLHDTYGFPIDLTGLIAQERGLRVDIGEYKRLMEEARERAKEVARTDREDDRLSYIATNSSARATGFVGYTSLTEQADVLEIIQYSGNVAGSSLQMNEGEEGVLILTQTPFYAERGGQVGDTGEIRQQNGGGVFRVRNTQIVHDIVAHRGRCVSGSFDLSGKPVRVLAEVTESSRRPTMQNHTATHMLNWALREVFGLGVQQKGSLVDPEKTRFDFSHNKPLTVEELTRIEALVNQMIDAGHPVYTKEVKQAKAREIDTLRAVFGEKYPDVVRVVSVGADIDAMLADPKNAQWMQCAVEFCGGTHLKNSAEAERFALVSEEAVAKGVRRVVGVTGAAAKQAETDGERLVAELNGLPSAGGDLGAKLTEFQARLGEAVIPVRVRHALRERIAELQKQAKEQQKQQAAASGEVVMERMAELLASAETIDGVTVVVGEVPAAQSDALRGAIDWVRNKTETSAVLLAVGGDGKVTLIAGMSKAVVKRGIKAGDLIREIAPIVGGKGGGRPDMAQGGGSQPEKLDEALASARKWIAAKLA